MAAYLFTLSPEQYTSLPVLLYAITDADVPKELAAKMPELYARSMLRVYYTSRGFVNWLAEGALTGMLSAYVPMVRAAMRSGPTLPIPDPAARLHSYDPTSRC